MKTSVECLLKKGEKQSIIVKFNPQYNVTKLKTIVYGGQHSLFGRLWVPFYLPNSDACRDSGFQCPLAIGEEKTYKFTIDVSKAYPSVRLFYFQNAFDISQLMMFRTKQKL